MSRVRRTWRPTSIASTPFSWPTQAGVLPPQGAGVDASEEATLGADSAEFSYVGQGHHSHRLPGCAPFVAGHHCAADDMLPMYIDYINANLHKDLMDAVGRREHWLDLHPRSMRSWAMAPMAIHPVGFGATSPQERARIPRRGRAFHSVLDGWSIMRWDVMWGKDITPIVCPLRPGCAPLLQGITCS